MIDIYRAGAIASLALSLPLLLALGLSSHENQQNANPSPTPVPASPERTVIVAGFYENLPITSWGTKNIR